MAASHEDTWLPLLEYSVRTGVSMSTLRRHIKSGRIQFKVQDGRYLVPLRAGDELPESRPDAQKFMPLAADMRLQAELRKAHEEIAELKSLIAVYEETLGARS